MASELNHNSYYALPESLYAATPPEPLVSPELLEINGELLEEYGLDRSTFDSESGLATLSGQTHASDNIPIAMAYAGHQFGQWVPLLGDGRAHMLGQLDTSSGAVDVQLKGSGRTRFSRGGDGRATLGSVIREHVVSEAMAGLSIPTTRSLAIIGTGTHVMREKPLPGAILVRTATSHLRVGTFQYASSLGESTVRALADFAIEHYFSDCSSQTDCYGALLTQVIERQAELIASWMLTGFIHGVMNTDNMSIVGETIDYGPCAFVDEFHPRKVFSSIDRMGRYAWNQQASIGLWNLTQFAQTLAPLLPQTSGASTTDAKSRLEQFAAVFENAFQQGFATKVGLSKNADISSIIQSTFDLLTEHEIDFTMFFDGLTQCATDADEGPFHALFSATDAGKLWLESWYALRDAHAIDAGTMRRANPRLIARNHQVEQAIAAAEANEDLSLFRTLCRALANPYELNDNDAHLARPPRIEERVRQTYCGT